MAGFVGSRLRVPFYTPRLPTGGGGGGVFQPRGAGLTTYKPNRSAEAIGGLGMLFNNYQVGLRKQKQMAQQRVMNILKMGQLDPTVLQSPEFQKARTVSGYPAMTMPKAATWDQLSTPRPGYSLPTVTTGPQGRIKGVTHRPKETYPEGFKADIDNAISAIERGADPYKVYRRISAAYPGQSIDLKRILMTTPAGNRLESLKQILFGNE